MLNSEYSLPSFADWETWKIVLGYGSALFATQFVETAVALNVVNRLDESDGPGFHVLFGQGMSNVLIGFMGGMGANGSLTMSVLSDRTSGTTCLSTFLTGAMLFVFTSWAYPVIDYMPLSAISGISIAIASSYIQWRSLVAVFTICIPDRKRPLIPQHFLFGRVEVCIILFITAACLIADVSALAFFVFAVAVGLVNVYRKWRHGSGDERHESGDEATTADAIGFSVNNTIAQLLEEGVLQVSQHPQSEVRKGGNASANLDDTDSSSNGDTEEETPVSIDVMKKVRRETNQSINEEDSPRDEGLNNNQRKAGIYYADSNSAEESDICSL